MYAILQANDFKVNDIYKILITRFLGVYFHTFLGVNITH
ncbi:hypothetical protein C723_3422 [Christiangramia flava JLT2011]|uniref:Uncharacterized protein n=1 Tax=Christiangramia flava JLT2011 TaxID=1229726 RepID=A0A1L7I1X7_9FLAO|nr:hypothetical protein GRFL_0904 [Christiangramia flava JLT2011]OSS37668.1 hypothetical protein C723_3422 [Christiangramia flava JLT2011]